LALVTGTFAMVQKAKLSLRIVRGSICVAIGLFVAPALLIAFSQSRIPATTAAALSTLVPVFTVVFEPYIGPNRAAGKELLPSILAVIGALLVFPFTLPSSLESSVAFLAVVLASSSIAAANCFAATLATQLESGSATMSQVAAIAASSSAISLIVVSAIFERSQWTWPNFTSEMPWAAALDLPALLLLFWLFARLPAPALATRYVVAPLFTILIGIVLLQSAQELQLRNWIGLLLMAAGAARMIFAPTEEKSITLNFIP
jgi:drug/metabolite transporter (DMT)-like permease